MKVELEHVDLGLLVKVLNGLEMKVWVAVVRARIEGGEVLETRVQVPFIEGDPCVAERRMEELKKHWSALGQVLLERLSWWRPGEKSAAAVGGGKHSWLIPNLN